MSQSFAARQRFFPLKSCGSSTYEKGEAPAAAADLKVGERVVVDVRGKDGDFTAAEIRFGASRHDEGHEEGHHEHH